MTFGSACEAALLAPTVPTANNLPALGVTLADAPWQVRPAAARGRSPVSGLAAICLNIPELNTELAAICLFRASKVSTRKIGHLFTVVFH